MLSAQNPLTIYVNAYPSPLGWIWAASVPSGVLRITMPCRNGKETLLREMNLSYRSALSLTSDVSDIDLTVAALPGQLPTAPATARRTGTLVVTAEQPLVRHTGRRVGQLRLSVDGEGNLTARDWESVPMDKEIPDDPEMARLLDAYWSDITDD